MTRASPLREHDVTTSNAAARREGARAGSSAGWRRPGAARARGGYRRAHALRLLLRPILEQHLDLCFVLISAQMGSW